jgi:deoxyribodipyrimidine photo-lyase
VGRSTGCDAQPYFRIFNPVSQSEKFDPQGKFIRRYLPQLAGPARRALHAPWLARRTGAGGRRRGAGRDYPLPVVDHALARETLERYAVGKKRYAPASSDVQGPG